MTRRPHDPLAPARGCAFALAIAIAVDVLIVALIVLWGLR